MPAVRYAVRDLVRKPDGKHRVAYIDLETGDEITEDLSGYTVIGQGDGLGNFTTDPGEKPDEAVEEIKKLIPQFLGDDTGRGPGDLHLPGPSDGILQRVLDNNYGFVDKPSFVSYLSALPGTLGMTGAAVNAGINFNNMQAVNSARTDMGLEALPAWESAKAVVFNNEGHIMDITMPDGSSRALTINPNVSEVNGKPAIGVAEATELGNLGIGTGRGAMTSTPQSGPVTEYGEWGPPAQQGLINQAQQPQTSTPQAALNAPNALTSNVPMAQQAGTPQTPQAQPGMGLASLAPSLSQGVNVGFHNPESRSAQAVGGNPFQGLQPHAQQSLTNTALTQSGGVNVTSSYRDPETNAAVGGTPQSLHQSGNAYDISLHGLTDDQKSSLVEMATVSAWAAAPEGTFPQIGAYTGGNGLHVGFAPVGGSHGYTPNHISDFVHPMFDMGIGNMSQAHGWFDKGLANAESIMKSGITPEAYNRAMEMWANEVAHGLPQSQNVTQDDFLGIMAALPEATQTAESLAIDSRINDAFTGQNAYGNAHGIDMTGRSTGLAGSTQSPQVNMADTGQFIGGTGIRGNDSPWSGYTMQSVPDSFMDPNGILGNISQTAVAQGDEVSPEIAAVQSMSGITVTSPAQAAALGYSGRSDEEIGAMAFMIAGEMTPAQIQAAINGDVNARTELANIITTVENRAGSGKWGENFLNVVTDPNQYNSMMKSNLSTTKGNFSRFGEQITALTKSFYNDPLGIKPSNYTLTHYHAPYVSPSWTGVMAGRQQVGDHIFGTLDSRFDVFNPLASSPQSLAGGGPTSINFQPSESWAPHTPNPHGAFSTAQGSSGLGTPMSHNPSQPTTSGGFMAGSLGGTATGAGTGLGAANPATAGSFSDPGGGGSYGGVGDPYGGGYSVGGTGSTGGSFGSAPSGGIAGGTASGPGTTGGVSGAGGGGQSHGGGVGPAGGSGPGTTGTGPSTGPGAW